MIFIKAALVALACCLTVNAQFTPGNPPVCSDDNVLAGVSLLAHEKYCQLFYSCNREVSYKMVCPQGLLWNSNINNCLPPTSGHNLATPGSFCQNWECELERNYPDLCCSKYWTCVNKVWVNQACPTDQVFDMTLGQCRAPSSGVACKNDQWCIESFPPKKDNDVCNLLPSPDGNPCKFTMRNSSIVQDVPASTVYDASICGFKASDQCASKAVVFKGNKNMDASCRASFRTDFTTLNSVGLPSAYSDKLNVTLGTGFGFSGVSVDNQEAVLSGSGSYIYSYFFAANEFASPVAISILFKPNNTQNDAKFILLSNQYEGNVEACGQTLRVAASYLGKTNINQNSWRFTIDMQGPTGGKDQFTFSATTSSDAYLRFTLTFNEKSSTGQAKAQLVEYDSASSTQGTVVGSGSSESNIGAFPYSRCGLAVGRNMEGRIREFNVYEGCGNSFSSVFIQG